MAGDGRIRCLPFHVFIRVKLEAKLKIFLFSQALIYPKKYLKKNRSTTASAHEEFQNRSPYGAYF